MKVYVLYDPDKANKVVAVTLQPDFLIGRHQLFGPSSDLFGPMAGLEWVNGSPSDWGSLLRETGSDYLLNVVDRNNWTVSVQERPPPELSPDDGLGTGIGSHPG